MLNKWMYVALSALLLGGCTAANQDEKSLHWGESRYIEDFLWVKNVPDTLTRTLVFDFNADAVNFMQDYVEVGFYKKDKAGELVAVGEEEMTLVVDGVEVPHNRIVAVPGEVGAPVEKQIGIVFNPTAEAKVHHWYLQVTKAGDLDRINDNDTRTGEIVLTPITVKRTETTNWLRATTHIVGIVFLAVLLLWFLVGKRSMYPKFKPGKIVLADPVPYYVTVTPLQNYRLVVLTSKQPAQSWLNKLFTGEIKYVVNPIWTSDVVFEPAGQMVRIKTSATAYACDALLLQRNQSCTLENLATRDKTQIKY